MLEFKKIFYRVKYNKKFTRKELDKILMILYNRTSHIAHRLNYSLLRVIFSVIQIILDIYLYNLVFSFMYDIKISFEVKAFLTGTMTAFFLFESLY